MASQRKKSSRKKGEEDSPPKGRSGSQAKVKGAEKGAAVAKKEGKKKSSATAEEAPTKTILSSAETTARDVHVVAAKEPGSFGEALRWTPGDKLADLDPAGTPAWGAGRSKAEDSLDESSEELSQWQEKLFAAAKGGNTAALLLVVQGMDTSGKGGIMRHVVGQCDPQGIVLTSFKAPTEEERAHPFLWRVRRALPLPGMIGVFDRSHYEDVLIARVQNLAPRATVGRRYGQIVAFENSVVKTGTVPIKVMLHISAQEQADRLQERLERPDKHWKYNPGDIDQRVRWNDYQEAYELALEKTSTDEAPWYVVPADRKWYARLAIQQLLLEHLRAIDPQWPSATFSPQVELERLRESSAVIAAGA